MERPLSGPSCRTRSCRVLPPLCRPHCRAWNPPPAPCQTGSVGWPRLSFPTLWMFSQILQPFDPAHVMRRDVTFPAGDCLPGASSFIWFSYLFWKKRQIPLVKALPVGRLAGLIPHPRDPEGASGRVCRSRGAEGGGALGTGWVKAFRVMPVLRGFPPGEEEPPPCAHVSLSSGG